MNQYYYVLCSVKCRVPGFCHQCPWFEILKKKKKEEKNFIFPAANCISAADPIWQKQGAYIESGPTIDKN